LLFSQSQNKRTAKRPKKCKITVEILEVTVKIIKIVIKLSAKDSVQNAIGEFQAINNSGPKSGCFLGESIYLNLRPKIST